MDLKDLNEELTCYISDSEKLVRVVEAFREMDRDSSRDGSSRTTTVCFDLYEKIKAIIDDE